jgi:hypothetical protein
MHLLEMAWNDKEQKKQERKIEATLQKTKREKKKHVS